MLAVFQKSRKVFTKIVDDPGQFITNFLNAIGQGFGRFGKNLGKHLKGAVFGWLMGTVSSGGINLPQKLDARGVFGLVMEVLGLTYDNVKAKLTKKLGPKAAKVIELLERSLGFFGEFAKKGPAALWEKVQQSLGNLRDLVIGKIRDWVVVRVVGAAVTRLLAMMNPAGALFTVAQAIYKTVMFFIDRWEQIKSLVVSIFGSIHDIAFGKLQKASEYIEKTLATGMTLAISFMARFLGLGGIGKKIQELVQTVRRPVNRALDKLISWLVKKGKALWGKAKATASRLKGKLVAWWKTTRVFKSRKGKNHKLFYRRKGRRAILMVASKETPVNSKNRKSAGGKAGAGLLPEPEQRRADALASELESQPASEQGTQSPAGTASRKRAESEVQGLMESSLDEGGAGQGTEQDPVLINWYKTAEAYAKIRVESTGGKVTMYSIDGGTSLAVPNPARGGDYSLKVDTDNLNPPSTSWLVGARKASKSHSERINQSLKQVGSVEDAGGTQLRSEEAKVHVDHIRDQALAEGAGVRDETRNAWYLTAAKNRAANATQKQYVLYKGAVSSLGDILTDKPHVVVDGTASIPGGGTPIGPGASMDEPYLGAQASQGLESLSDQDKFQGTAGDPVRIKWWKRPSDYVSIDQKQVSGGLPPAIMPDPNYLNPTGISWKVEGDTESKTLFSSRFNRKVRAKLGVKRDRDIPIVEVSLEYGGSRIQPDRDEELYEIDHVRDRALGGKDGPKNVWPIPKTNHDKVRANVEQYVLFRGKSVKAGQLKGPVHVKVHSRPGLPSSSAVNTEDSPVGYQKVRGQWQRRS
ncbi:MAG: hypothetical protein MPN21_11775 [Thermoanaerobaculia bacterium]|nr:hypothetical protein [Thermoanaerobaculia bacterium]